MKIALMAFYPQIKAVHVARSPPAASLFSLRGARLQAGKPRWPMAAAGALLSYTVDTALLTAALMLFTLLPGAMFSNGWLTAKLCSGALHRARRVRAQPCQDAARPPAGLPGGAGDLRHDLFDRPQPPTAGLVVDAVALNHCSHAAIANAATISTMPGNSLRP